MVSRVFHAAAALAGAARPERGLVLRPLRAREELTVSSELRTWPMMTREQWNELVTATEVVAERLRVHLGAEAPEWRALNATLELALLELERRMDARRPAL
jgi:hypothetical protein